MRIQLRNSFAATIALCLSFVAHTRADAQLTYTYQSQNYNVFSATNPAYTYTPAEFFTFTLFMPTAMADLVYSRPDNMGGAIRKGRVTTAGTWTVTSAIVATPESASVVLLGSGLAGFAIVGRRRRIQRAG